MIGFKSYRTGNRWYANAAEVDLRVMKRTVQTKSGTSPYHYFDGPTMVSYQVPHRAVEAVFCRRQPTPNECREAYQYESANPNGPSAPLDSGVGDSNELSRPGSDQRKTAKFNPMADRHFRHQNGGSFCDINAAKKMLSREGDPLHNLSCHAFER